MVIIKLCFDYVNGPIWKEVYDVQKKVAITEVDVIDNDTELQELNDYIQGIYASFYEFDSHDVACYFNEEAYKASKEPLLDLMGKLKARLDEINDGSFEVEDYITSELEEL